MKLSIITINRNNGQGLRKTMQSVLSQTWKEFEYIIIDGASNDNSVDVIESEIENVVDKENPIVNYVSEQDTGVFNAMNKGINKTTGRYLLFLNSGDYLVDKDVLKSFFANEYASDIIIGKCRVSNNGESIALISPPDIISFGFFYNNSLAHQATFIKKSLFDEYGSYRDDLKFMGDWEFFLRTIILGNATTKNSDIIVSDYNMNGISSVDANQTAIIQEKNQIYQQSILRNFLADYEHFNNKMKELEMISWAWKKRIFRWSIKYVFSVVKFVNK